MSAYLKSRAWLEQLVQSNQDGVQELIDEYEAIKAQCGDIRAAHFLIDVHTEFSNAMECRKNG